jgi:hypothetical protein
MLRYYYLHLSRGIKAILLESIQALVVLLTA